MASNFGRDLLERRVPQYLAVYLGASWAVIEFFAFLEDRFLLSPHLTNLVLLILVLVLPSVVMFTYFHGRKGADAWTRTEKIFIPANVLVVAVILLAAFSGKELGAVTTTVTVRDEAGNPVERVVPRSEFRQRLALFPLDPATSDGEQAWLGEGVADALTVDLMQDMFVDVEQWSSFQEELEDAGYETGQGIPGALKRRLTQERHLGHYLDGTAERAQDEYRFTLTLHDAGRGQVVTERSYRGPDLFALVDEASVQLRRDLEIPARHIEQNPDVPVSQILTTSVPALRSMSEATVLSVSPAGLPSALEKLDAAVAEDPAFALAQLERFGVLVRMGDTEGAREAIQQAMEHSYRLPERLQYHVKGEWFGIQLDLPKMFAVFEMWAELYPHDLQALSAVAQIRQIQDDRRGAIETYEQILELDPDQVEVLPRIASLYEAMGEPRRARRFYERYVEANPQDRDPYLSLAGLHRRLGEHEQARELYDRALLMAPGDVDIMVAMASLDLDTGHFEDALAGYQAAVDVARTPRQRYTALQELAGYHVYRGSFGAAIGPIERAAVEGRSFQAPISQSQMRLLSLDTYVLAGQPDRALELLDSLAAQLAPPLDAIVPIGRIQVFAALEQPEPLADAVQAGKDMLARLQYNQLRQPVVWGEGRLHELRGEWAEAAMAFQQAREANPMEPRTPAMIGRCYLELGDLGRAESLIRETLKALPSHARSHFELARVYDAMGRQRDAIVELEQALDTWAPADSTYGPVREARALLATLDPGR